MGQTHHCALVEQGGRCCEGAAMQGMERCIMMPIFGALVIAGLIAMLILQVKTLRALGKIGKKR